MIKSTFQKSDEIPSQFSAIKDYFKPKSVMRGADYDGIKYKHKVHSSMGYGYVDQSTFN